MCVADAAAAGLGQHRGVGGLGRLHRHGNGRTVTWRIHVGAAGIGVGRAVELAVAVGIHQVAALVKVVGGGPLAVAAAALRPGNVVVVDEVLVVVGRRVAAHHAVAAVVDHGVHHLGVALHLGIAALVVGPKAVADGPVARAVGDGPEALRVYSLGDDAVLPGDVVGILDVNIVPSAPRNGAMVEDYVLRTVHGERAAGACHTDGAAHADVLEDDVGAVADEHAVAVDGDAVARSGLSEHGDVAVPVDGDHLAGRQADDAAHVEHHDAVAAVEGFGQRTGACGLEVGHVHHGAGGASAGGQGAEALGTGKGRQLCGGGCREQKGKEEGVKMVHEWLGGDERL